MTRTGHGQSRNGLGIGMKLKCIIAKPSKCSRAGEVGWETSWLDCCSPALDTPAVEQPKLPPVEMSRGPEAVSGRPALGVVQDPCERQADRVFLAVGMLGLCWMKQLFLVSIFGRPPAVSCPCAPLAKLPLHLALPACTSSSTTTRLSSIFPWQQLLRIP